MVVHICCCLITKLCPTLCNPTYSSPPGSSVYGISLAIYWSGLPFPSLVYLPHPRIKPTSPALAVGFFATLPPGKPSMLAYNSLKDQQALCLDIKLTDMYLTESEDTVVHTDFSYTDNACHCGGDLDL